MPFSLSPVRLGVALLSGALATGIFHVAQKGEGTSAIAAALGVPEPAVVTPNDVPPSVPKAAAAGRAAGGVVSDKSKPGGWRGTATDGLKTSSVPGTRPEAAKAASAPGTAPGSAKQAAAHRTAPGTAKQATAHRTAPGTVKQAIDRGTAGATGRNMNARASAPGTLAVANAPKRIVFRHDSPGIIVLTLQGDQLDVEFKEGR